MVSQEIRSLLKSPSLESPKRDGVLYLNSKFHGVEDLVGLSEELLTAEHWHAELTSRLSSSQTRIDELVVNSRAVAESHVQTAQGLSLIRHSITDELHELSERLASVSPNGLAPTLLEDVEALHRDLKELESIRGYVRVIEHALNLSETAVKHIRDKSASTDSLTVEAASSYQVLQAFVSRVSASCSAAENGGQLLHLLSFLSRVHKRTWLNMKEALASPLLEAAEQLNWPTPVDYAMFSADVRAKFERSFRRLLQLQRIGEQIGITEERNSGNKGGLYPLEVLVQPISLRFKYHFEGERQTNRPDKPEWYFTHILNVIHDHRSFMENVVQMLLSSSGYTNVNAWHEFTILVLPLLSRKLRRTVPSLLPHPSLLAHTIYQTLSFDTSLVESGFDLTNTSARGEDSKWPGLSEIILGQKEWFDSWIDGEKRFTETQYHEIISAPDAWQIADDDPEGMEPNSDVKTTNSARQVKALTEQITERYSALPSFSHRTRFLISVQLPILESYHGRISASLDAFETLSSALIRAVPGALGVSLGVKDDVKVNVDTRRLTTGIDGVQRLCKAFLSAVHITSAMKAWGEDLFFLELWTEINRRAGLRAQAQANSVLPNPSTENNPETIFEELIVSYQKLCQRTEDIIVQQIGAEVETSLKAHFSAITSPNPNSPAPAEEVTLSQTLLGPLALLSAHLSFVRATLPRSIMTTLYRRIAFRLAEHILQRQILYRGHISSAEGKAALAESELWVETCQTSLGGSLGGGRKRVETPWAKLLQAGRIIGADDQTTALITQATFGTVNQEEWEEQMIVMTGFQELNREEVGRLLRRRE
ncbi:RINT-1 family protein [Marasmius fiardii PR-910]|nr:RINT-1 family protein [Marasmius fiardii PR-910]